MGGFVPSAEQDYDLLTPLAHINAVAGTEVYAQLAHPSSNTFAIAEVSEEPEALQSRQYPRAASDIREASQPEGECRILYERHAVY